jgi:trimethylamine:corrinoid methyltransferase-like protein
VEELIDFEEGDLNEADLVEYDMQNRLAESESSDVPEQPRKVFSAKKLAEAFNSINNGLMMIEDMDENSERIEMVQDHIKKSLSCYYTIYNEKKRAAIQTDITKYFNKTD